MRLVKLFILPLLFSLLLLNNIVSAQSPLDLYIKEGLENNLLIKQKHLNLQKAVYALKAANSLFLPSVNFNASYTHGRGGRAIALPVGDMLNPVYATLNEMMGSNEFPQIQNVDQSFFPQNFYDSKVRTSVPLINTDLYSNKSIHQDQVILEEFEKKVYERELVKSIKTAYYNYLSALEAQKILESALELVQQNVEVNESLLKNGKGLPASVLRAKSEYENINAQLNDAKNTIINARHYFNFLLNREQQHSIKVPENLDPELAYAHQLIDTPKKNMREELEMIKTSRSIQTSFLKMNRNFYLPKMNAFFDVGAQAENLKINNDARYFLVGVSLDVPIYNGFRNNYKIKQTELDLERANLNLDQTRKHLDMATDLAINNLNTAFQNYSSSLRQLQAAQSYFKLIERGYKEGTNSMIEFLDGRNQMTSSQMQVNINTYKVLIALAQYERETASFPLTQY